MFAIFASIMIDSMCIAYSINQQINKKSRHLEVNKQDKN
jgi:hypothetical protein